MSFALTLILIVVVTLTICSAMYQSRLALLTLPCLASLVMALWLIPQLLVAHTNPTLSEGGQVLLSGLAILGLGMTLVGWRMGAARPLSLASLRHQIDVDIRGLRNATILAVLGTSLVQFLILQQPAVSLASRQPSGLITILRTLAMLNPVALFCALLLLSRRPGVLSVALVAVAVGTYAQELVFQIKRTSFLELGLVIVLWRYVVAGWHVPRSAFLAGLPVAVAGLHLVHEIRRPSGYRVGDNGELVLAWPNLDTLLNTDWIAIMIERVSADYYEVSNAVLTLQNYVANDGFGWGRHLWNLFVFRWVPGQLVGADTKAGLMFDLPTMADIVGRQGLEWKLGTTATGFADPFADFAVFGVLVFLVNAWIAAHILSRGLRGSLPDLAVSVPVLSAATVSLTHNGYALFMLLPLVLPARAGLRWLIRPARRSPNVSYVIGAA